MKNKKSTHYLYGMYAFFIFCFLSLPSMILPGFSQEAAYDDLHISLLTVHPRDKAVYAIFGHTAIRIKSESGNMDYVYNYGYFDASKPHFIYHFVKGETDYVLGVDECNYFLYKYSLDNSYIEEQVLNLSQEEKKNVLHFLNQNALPENREYRYDYFFDNCTTRPRDIIENYLQGKLNYPKQKAPTTLRTLVHECTRPYPWLEFGIDLVIGSGADSTICLRTEMFLPIKLMEALDQSMVTTDSASYSLVKDKVILLQPTAIDTKEGSSLFSSLFSPTNVTFAVLLLSIGISVAGYRRKRPFRGFDIALFAAAGIAGIIVCFISFISTHPCTSGNYHTLWLHPLHLVAAICFSIKTLKSINYWYHLVNFAVLTVFLLGFRFFPQEIPLAAVILVSCLWIRSLYNGSLHKKFRRERRSTT